MVFLEGMQHTKNIQKAKSFLKWAGGKTQLIFQIEARLPKTLLSKKNTFIEPFVGGGAMLFWMLQKFPKIEKAIINDINTDLINCYQIIKENVEALINILFEWQDEYHELLKSGVSSNNYYNGKRIDFNKRTASRLIQSALFIFLKKTCFNGLYRVNKKNEFNVPIGGYKKPVIYDTRNLRATSELLQKVVILNGSYNEVKSYVNDTTFIYLDPP